MLSTGLAPSMSLTSPIRLRRCSREKGCGDKDGVTATTNAVKLTRDDVKQPVATATWLQMSTVMVADVLVGVGVLSPRELLPRWAAQ